MNMSVQDFFFLALGYLGVVIILFLAWLVIGIVTLVRWIIRKWKK